MNNATSAAAFVDTVNFGSGIATVTDNLAYFATATSTTTGNLLELTGTLHGEILAFSTPIANTTSALGADDRCHRDDSQSGGVFGGSRPPPIR